MIYQQFPDLVWLKKQAEENFANHKAWSGRSLPTAGWPSVVLNVKTKNTFRDDIRGPLSIFSNMSGTSSVHCDKKKTTVHEGFFFVTNHDQRYTLDINHKTEAETFNIHFGEYWADQVFDTISNRVENLLDGGLFETPLNRVEFHNKLYAKDDRFTHLALQLKSATDNKLREEELMYEMLVHLLRQDAEIRKAEMRLPSLKNSTRSEIIKTLTNSTDYIYTYFQKDLSLDELASVSCMSKFHFLRLFKTAFGKTPHQFISEVKISQAKNRLVKTSHDVKEIARSLGFKDASTFSRLFKNQVGVYPTQYR